MMLGEEEQREIVHEGMAQAHIELSYGIYGLLNGLCEQDAFDFLMNVPEGNGLEAWRRFHAQMAPKTPGHSLTKLKWIMEPRDITGTFE